MKSVIRSVLVVLAGVIAGAMVIFIVEVASAAFFDLASPVDGEQATQLIPPGAFAMVLMGWFLGTALGTYTTAKLSGESRVPNAAVVALMLFAAGVYNLTNLDHPIWMWPGAILAFLLGGMAGAKLGGAARDPLLGETPMGP